MFFLAIDRSKKETVRLLSYVVNLVHFQLREKRDIGKIFLDNKDVWSLKKFEETEEGELRMSGSETQIE